MSFHWERIQDTICVQCAALGEFAIVLRSYGLDEEASRIETAVSIFANGSDDFDRFKQGITILRQIDHRLRESALLELADCVRSIRRTMTSEVDRWMDTTQRLSTGEYPIPTRNRK